MAALEIPRQNWQQYFEEFSKLHEGWATTIEVIGRDVGDQPAANGLPLQGLSFESKGSARGDVLIEVGDTEPAYNTHRVHRPKTLRVADTRPGLETDVEIESEDGQITVVRLRQLSQLPPPQQHAAQQQR